ncbi:MAG: hypothetical protein GOMPHAMPRED_003683 [Gomphillus americanus]|uniref:AAA+ ATPase domain-containing protein n=1 Tax=Gomphillus americanus TaxID=1940652 RepID=A0A8H3ISL0_9LECA|nr:MAG: hypothetical protein GOMPHAMPRED_003683 [Gomphillus americanus]
MSKYSLRPVHRSSPDIKDVYKIFVPPKLYVSLRSGTSLWTLEDEQGTPVAIGKLSQAQDEIQNKVLQVAHEFKDLFSLSFSDNYILKKSDSQVRYATELVLVEEIREDGSSLLTSNDRHFWEGRLQGLLLNKLVSPGLCIEHVEAPSQTRSFRVKTISNAESANDLHTPMDIHNVSKDCNVRIDISRSSNGDVSRFGVDRRGLFGLEEQLDTIDQILDFYGPLRHPYYRITQAGLLLIGPAGSGTNLIADRISGLPWTNKRIVTETEIGKSPATSVPQIFLDCSKNQPCLIRIQQFQRLLSNLGTRLEDALIHAFSITKGTRVTVLAEVESIKMPSLLLSCFQFKIHITALDENARYALILHELVVRESRPQPTEKVITIVSQKTPGYTRDDLQQLVEEAIFYAHIRLKLASKHVVSLQDTGSNPEAKEFVVPKILDVTLDDFEEARELVSPFSLGKDSVSKYRTVRWSDIGGQEETKEMVEMLFEWPLRYPEKFEALGLRPGKGLLLYGPPGCSKTMTALALATEAKLNFIAIKGPELLTKYVGESEQNLRNTFARAQSMSPCVVFFDEIDSIDSGGSMSGGSRGGGVNLIGTLLNELDGVDEMKGVYILAATNKPWELDPALLRPGRFDSMIYVKLPDAKTRRDILQIRLDTMQHGFIDLDMLVEQTEGCSGAEVVDLCRNAAMAALKEQIHLKEETKVTGIHFEKALLQLRRDTSPDMVALFDAFANRSRRV